MGGPVRVSYRVPGSVWTTLRDGDQPLHPSTVAGPGLPSGHSKQIRHWSLIRMLHWPLPALQSFKPVAGAQQVAETPVGERSWPARQGRRAIGQSAGLAFA